MTIKRCVKMSLAFGMGISAANATGQDCAWAAMGSQFINGVVQDMVIFDDGSGPALYIGGGMVFAGQPVNGIARWDGSAWVDVGGGVNGFVNALAVFDDGDGPALYAGGFFADAGGVPATGIARWDGAAWSALDGGVSGFDETVLALAVHDDGSGPALYVGGFFSHAGGLPANRIARWSGSEWSGLGAGVSGCNGQSCNTLVLSLTSYDLGDGPALFVGGNFTSAGGQAASSVARWDGSGWSALGAGLSQSNPFFLAEGHAVLGFDDGTGPALYVGGAFDRAGGQPASSFARWNGSAWQDIGGSAQVVLAMAAFDDGTGPALYAGGGFEIFGGVDANRVARWDGNGWSALGSGVNGAVWSLMGYDDGDGPALLAGGDFATAGGSPASRIARWSCAAAGCPADLDGNGLLNFFDVAAFIALYNAGDPAADLAPPFGVFNFFDIAAYMALYNDGCP